MDSAFGFSTDGQRARVLTTANSAPVASIPVSIANADVSARVSLVSLPAGGSAGAVIAARLTGTSYLGARLAVDSSAKARLEIIQVQSGSTTELGSAGVVAKYKAGQIFWLRLQTTGSTARARSWADGAVEPTGWQVSVSTPSVAGSVGFGAFGGAGLAGSVTASADDFSATDSGVPGSVGACTGTSASYSGLAVGAHLFRISARNATDQVVAIYPWTITEPPPSAPTVSLTQTPSDPTTDTGATFAWSTTGTVTSTTCTLDGTPQSCTSPATYTSLAAGNHTLRPGEQRRRLELRELLVDDRIRRRRPSGSHRRPRIRPRTRVPHSPGRPPEPSPRPPARSTEHHSRAPHPRPTRASPRAITPSASR